MKLLTNRQVTDCQASAVTDYCTHEPAPPWKPLFLDAHFLSPLLAPRSQPRLDNKGQFWQDWDTARV